MLSGLTRAVVVSLALHAGLLVLGRAELLGQERSGGFRAEVVTALSLQIINTPEAPEDGAARRATAARGGFAPASAVGKLRESPVSGDRASSEEDSAPAALDVTSEADGLLFPGVRYFKGVELTERPRPVDKIELSYPMSGELPEADRSGSIILRLLIAESGAVDRVLVESSELPETFQVEATRRFAQAQFFPGRIGELAVRSQMRVEVTFFARS